MTVALNLNWNSPGPVATSVFNDWRPVVADMGPIGCGKTTTMAMKMVVAATRQRRSKMQGTRLFKLCVVAPDYRRLWKNLIPSWLERLPKHDPVNGVIWKGGEGEPAAHEINIALSDGSRAQLLIDFIAIGENRAEDVLRGYQPTAFWLTEADLLAPEVFQFARGRAGRYPRMDEGGPDPWFGIVMDFNAPDIDNWIYTDLIEKAAEFAEWFGFHRQPSGFAADAENRQNLPPGYYDNQAKGQPDWYVRRMIRNDFGYSRAGKPVYEEFSEGRHSTREILKPLPGISLRIGMDAGLTPAASIAQHLPNGQRRVLACVITDESESVGMERFGERLNRLLADPLFSGWDRKQIIARADPSAAYGADKQGGERTWIEAVSHVTGIAVRPARTNNLLARLEAVRKPMTRDVGADIPGFLISGHPSCKKLIRAYASDYRYRRLQGVGGFTDVPDKNHASHIADADQYRELTDDEYLEVIGRKRSADGGRRQISAITDDNPQGEFEQRQSPRQTHAITDEG